MLTPIDPPTDLGKRGELTKHSAALDRMTAGDTGDLRFYSSNDGRRSYLRVWETPDPNKPQGTPRWYIVSAGVEALPHEPNTKKA